MLLATLALVLFVIILFYVYLVWNFGYWKKRGIKEPKAYPLFGSYPSAFTRKRHVIYDLDDIYRQYKKTENFVGIFSSRLPQLLITCPNLAHRILVTDFKHFHDNEASTVVDEKSDLILSHNPFTLTGSAWKETRSEILPALSSSKIKAVYPVTRNVCKNLSNFLREQTRIPPKNGIDTKDLCFRFTAEIVSDCVFGMQANCFVEDSVPIMRMLKKIFDQSFILIMYQIIAGIAPWIRHIYKIRFVPKEIETFLVEMVKKASDLRRSGDEHLRQRNDFLNFMLQLQERKKFDQIHLAAHTLTFLLDGSETTASVITHCLLLLARDQDCFRKLRQEIAAHMDSTGEINFESLNEMPFLDACIHESIRVFPAGLFTNKICTESIELINKDGRALRVKKGQVVVVPLTSFMHDEDYYPNPQEFRPERFLEEPDGLKKYREKGLYFGFGDGPRICLGMRFALPQAKAAIVEIVQNFNIRVNPKTRKDNKMDPVYLLARLDGGVWLDFEERSS